MKFSFVTPSYNRENFIEESMLSVLNQRGAEIEYIVMDGGSKDGSVEIIRKYESRLSHWESAKDGGHFDAITRGLNRSTGEVMGWLNTDDLLTPWAVAVAADIFIQLPEVQWLTTTTQIRWDAQSRAVRALHVPGYSRQGFLRGEYLPAPGEFALGWIQQESTFWRRSLWEKAGSIVGPGYPLAGDFDLWGRFMRHADLYAVDTPLGGFRFHGDQKTGGDRSEYYDEGERSLVANGGYRHNAVSRLLRRWKLLRYDAKVVRHNRHTGKWQVVTVRV